MAIYQDLMSARQHVKYNDSVSSSKPCHQASCRFSPSPAATPLVPPRLQPRCWRQPQLSVAGCVLNWTRSAENHRPHPSLLYARPPAPTHLQVQYSSPKVKHIDKTDEPITYGIITQCYLTRNTTECGPFHPC